MEVKPCCTKSSRVGVNKGLTQVLVEKVDLFSHESKDATEYASHSGLNFLLFFYFLKTTILPLLKAAPRGSLHQLRVTGALMVVCPVYYVYYVLADISAPLGRERPLICRAVPLERNRVSTRDAGRGRSRGKHQKGEMLNILIPFLALHVHPYLRVWAPWEEAEWGVSQWFTLLKGPWHKKTVKIDF